MSEAKLPEQLTTAEVMAMVKAMSPEERAELDALGTLVDCKPCQHHHGYGVGHVAAYVGGGCVV